MSETKTVNEKVIAFALENYGKLETLFKYGFGDDGHYEIQVSDGHIRDIKFTKHLYQRRKSDRIY